VFNHHLVVEEQSVGRRVPQVNRTRRPSLFEILGSTGHCQNQENCQKPKQGFRAKLIHMTSLMSCNPCRITMFLPSTV
jgi:hypothetical protein